MKKYDFSTLSDIYNINSVEDAINLLLAAKRVAFIGDPGLGKSYLSNLIQENIDKDKFVVRRLKAPKIDEIRAVIKDFTGDFASQDKEKLLIIDETDKASKESLDELLVYTDPENAENFIQIHVIYLMNNDCFVGAVNSRTIKINFEYPTIANLVNFWKDSELRNKLTKNQIESINTHLTILSKDKQRLSHRDFFSCLTLMSSSPDIDFEKALRLKRSDVFNEKDHEKELKDIYKVLTAGNDPDILAALRSLKSDEKIIHLFSYIRAIAKSSKDNRLHLAISQAQCEFLNTKWSASIYNAVDFNMSKYIILYTCLMKAFGR